MSANLTIRTRNWLVIGATTLIVLAGIIHLVIVPHHWSHSPGHGLFFALSGIAELTWGIAFWRRPSRLLYRIGVVLALTLIVLWVITRFLPAPFDHEPEPVDLAGVACKLSEGLGVLTLIALAVTGTASWEQRATAWRIVAVLVLVAIVFGWGTYGVAQAAEPLFPFLMAPAEYFHDEPIPTDHAHPGTVEPDHSHESAP